MDRSETRTGRRPRYRTVTILAVLLLAGLLGNAAVQPFNQDEEMYVSVGVLSLSHTLYVDFMYNQPPVYPLFLAGLFSLADERYVLLARAASAMAAAGSVFLFFLIAYRLCGNRAIALVASALFASAPLFLVGAGSARNDALPVLLGLFAVWCLLRAVGAARRADAWLVAAGLAMALAVGAKVTAAFVPLAGLIYLATTGPDQPLVRIKRMVWLSLGGLIGALPIIAYLWRAPAAFVFSVFEFQMTAPFDFYQSVGQGDILTRAHQFKVLAGAWLENPVLVGGLLLVAVSVLVMLTRRRDPNAGSGIDRRQVRLMALLFLTALPFVLIPRPLFLMHVLPIMPYFLLLCISCLRLVRHRLTGRERGLLGAIAAVAMAAQLALFAIAVAPVHQFERWPANGIHALAQHIDRNMAVAGVRGPIATLHGGIAVDAGRDLHPAFSLGPYFYRSGHIYDPERVLRFGGIAPDLLDRVFAATALPAAVLVGSSNDVALAAWAKANCYAEAHDGIRGWESGPYIVEQWRPRLYLRSPDGCNG